MNYGLKLYLNQIKKDFDKGNMSLQKQEKESIIKTIDLNSKIIFMHIYVILVHQLQKI